MPHATAFLQPFSIIIYFVLAKSMKLVIISLYAAFLPFYHILYISVQPLHISIVFYVFNTYTLHHKK